MNIANKGTITVPRYILDHAETIKHENYKTNTPAKFQKHTTQMDGCPMAYALSPIIGIDPFNIDWVYFSACQGAEPHTDLLDPAKFGKMTYVVPIILPKGKSTIFVEDEHVDVDLNNVYMFDHSKTHGMNVQDCDSGCVMIMAAVLTPEAALQKSMRC